MTVSRSQPGTIEPMNVTEPVRCALARHAAGYAWDIDCDDVATLLAAYDALTVPRCEAVTEIVRELRDDYPAVDVTSVVFSRDFAGVGHCVIPQDRVLAIIATLESLAPPALPDAPVREAKLAALVQELFDITEPRNDAARFIALPGMMAEYRWWDRASAALASSTLRETP